MAEGKRQGAFPLAFKDSFSCPRLAFKGSFHLLSSSLTTPAPVSVHTPRARPLLQPSPAACSPWNRRQLSLLWVPSWDTLLPLLPEQILFTFGVFPLPGDLPDQPLLIQSRSIERVFIEHFPHPMCWDTQRNRRDGSLISCDL